MAEYDQRLERIESKIDQLADAMISLARAEEKIGALQDDHNKMYERMNKFSTKLDDMEVMVRENSRVTKTFQRACWIFFGAIVTSVVAHFYMMN
tara:strand:+ start:924 stop:1205 length:282 start_codon:yes stop_codon:yes gene_type:complete